MGDERRVDGSHDLPCSSDATQRMTVRRRGLITLGGALLLFLVIACWHPLGAAAATITVTNTADATTTGDGVSLREAVLSINAGGDLNSDVAAHRTICSN